MYSKRIEQKIKKYVKLQGEICRVASQLEKELNLEDKSEPETNWSLRMYLFQSPFYTVEDTKKIIQKFLV